MISRLKNELGMRLNGVQINVDLVAGCCLACPSCAVGSIGGSRKGLMTPELFLRILDKAEREFKVRRVMLYVYSDPCMHRDLHYFVQECTDRGIETWISTMLQVTNCDFEKVIEARPTEFRISYPGFEQMGYYQSPKASVERFKRKLDEVSCLPRHKETTWTLFFHHYRDNSHEIPEAEVLAKEHGLKLVVIPAIFMVLERMIRGDYSESDLKVISRLWETPEEAVSRMKRTDDCIMWKQLTLGANGEVYLCQLVWSEEFKIAYYLDTPWKEIRRRMKTHPFCGECLSKGGDQYQSCYAPPATSLDPVGEANAKRRVWN